MDVVKELLAREADANAAADSYGATPLHIATNNGHVDVVAELVKHRVSPEGGATSVC